MSVIVVLGDLHFPFHSKPAVKWAINKVKELQPDHIIQIGDLYDFFSASKFPKRQFIAPEDEYVAGYEFAKELWQKLQEAAPKAKLYQIKGNHDDRPAKRIIERIPELIYFLEKGLSEFFNFPGVKTFHDPKDELEIKEIKFIHGYRSRIGEHCRYYLSRIVCGHSHRGGVYFEQRHGQILWELNCGYLADESHEALKYRPTKTSPWTLGIGLIDDDGPRFIPYE